MRDESAFHACRCVPSSGPADGYCGRRVELNGFRECSVDQHTGILEYNRERIVVGLTDGTLILEGCGLEIRLMHRDRLTITGRIECVQYEEGRRPACGA